MYEIGDYIYVFYREEAVEISERVCCMVTACGPCWAAVLTVAVSHGTFFWLIEPLHMMSQHSNSLATAMAAILVHKKNLLRLCTTMAAVSMAKGCMQTLFRHSSGQFSPLPDKCK